MQVMALAVDANRIYVTIRVLECVVVADMKGRKLCEWGRAGSDIAQFDRISGIAVHGSAVFVASNGRIQRFRKDGSFQALHEVKGSVHTLICQGSTLYALTSLGVCAFCMNSELRMRFAVTRWTLRDIAANAEELFIFENKMYEPASVSVFAAHDGTPLRSFQTSLRIPWAIAVAPNGTLLANSGEKIFWSRIDTWSETHACPLEYEICCVAFNGSCLLGLRFGDGPAICSFQSPCACSPADLILIQ